MSTAQCLVDAALEAHVRAELMPWRCNLHRWADVVAHDILNVVRMTPALCNVSTPSFDVPRTQ